MTPPPNVVIEPTVFPKHPKLARSGDVQPFPYQGSKRALASAIIPLMGESVRVVEPFAGSAAISIAARLAGVSHSGVIADVNEPLMDLWQAIIDEPMPPIPMRDAGRHHQRTHTHRRHGNAGVFPILPENVGAHLLMSASGGNLARSARNPRELW